MNAPAVRRVSTRRAESADQAFAYELRALTMRAWVEATWGVWDEALARGQIASDIDARRLQVVEVDARRAGMLRVDESDSETHLDQIFLLPEYQRQGIGSELVRGVLRASHAKGLPVRLWVLRVNPARHFYEAMGFAVFEETHASFHMQCPPLSPCNSKPGSRSTPHPP